MRNVFVFIYICFHIYHKKIKKKVRKEIKEKCIGRIFEATQSGGPPLDGIHIICVTSSRATVDCMASSIL